MTIDVGISSFSYPWAIGQGAPPTHRLDALGLLERARELGVGVVQYADNLPLHELEPDALERLRADASAAGIRIEVGTRGIDAGLTRYVELAATFGAGFVRIVIDREDDHPAPDEAIARLEPFETDFRDAGVVLAIENHDRFTTAQLLAIVDRLGDWTAICLDTVNSLGALETPDAVIAALAPRAVNLHLKDFAIRRVPTNLGFIVEGAPAGEGLLDVPALVRAVEPTAVRTAVLELWTPPGPSLAATIDLEADWARRSIAYLRTVAGLSVKAAASPTPQ